MKGAGDSAFALQFANVAQVDESHVIAAVLGDPGFDRQGFDLAFGGFDQSAESGADRLRHRRARILINCAAWVAPSHA